MQKIRVFVDVFIGSLLLICCDSKNASTNLSDFEGDEIGECEDDADNDRDGAFDCDDPDCAGSSVCKGTGATVEDTEPSTSDGDSDSNVDSGGDVDGDADADSDADTEYLDTEIDTSDWVIPTNENAPAPMPVISRGDPIYTSARPDGIANDADYDTYIYVDGAQSDGPIWIAYDLSRIPRLQRGEVVVHWINDFYWYSHELDELTRCPRTYTIDAHAANGGTPPSGTDSGWITLVSITEDDPNMYHSRQHVVNMTDGDTVYNWIRIYVTSIYNSENLNINMDVHDAHMGADDTWIFYGDSITAWAMRLDSFGDENFPQIINGVFPQYYPAQENAGVAGWTTGDAVEAVPRWVKDTPARYVGLSFGTNDSSSELTNEEFYANYETMVRAIIDEGKIPVIPTIPWCRQTRITRIQELNEQLDVLKEAYPEIVDGPDLWTLFYENQDLIDSDDLHPSKPEGDLAYRRAWAEAMISIVYGI